MQAKNIINILFAFSLSAVLLSCTSNDDTGNVSADYMKVTDVVIEGQNTSGTLQIEADCSWTITSDASWVTVGTPQGEGSQGVTLTTGINPSSVEERNCQLTVTSKGGVTRVVNVKQTRNNESLQVSITEHNYGEQGGSVEFTITSNTTWTITGGADWLTLSTTSGSGNASISMTAQANDNDNEEERRTTLTVTGSGGAHSDILIIQAAKTVTLTIEPEEIPATAKGDVYTFRVQSNTQWNVTTSVEGWVTIGQASGSNNGEVNITLSDNAGSEARTANIRVVSASGRHTQTCVITQAGATPPTLTAPVASGIGRYEFSVSTNFNSPLNVSESGFCYSETTQEPTINNINLPVTSQGTSGSFSLKLENLKSGRTYYVRAWARNANGIGYSATTEVRTEGNVPGEDENTPPNL